jgi:hypothetical protein
VDESRRLRTLAAELRGEVARIDRCQAEIGAARPIADRVPERLALYGMAALLETFYTGIEKAFVRIANAFGGLPDGPAWHRAVLEDMVLDIPRVRPPVIREETARELERYLAFRHRFRNLYLFDLQPDLVAPLLRDGEAAWSHCREDLLSFAAELEEMADALTP